MKNIFLLILSMALFAGQAMARKSGYYIQRGYAKRNGQMVLPHIKSYADSNLFNNVSSIRRVRRYPRSL